MAHLPVARHDAGEADAADFPAGVVHAEDREIFGNGEAEAARRGLTIPASAAPETPDDAALALPEEDAEIDEAEETARFESGDMFLIRNNIMHTFVYNEDTYLVALYDRRIENEDGTKDIISAQ